MKPTLRRCARGWLLVFKHAHKVRSFAMFGATAEERRAMMEPKIVHLPCYTQQEGFDTLALAYRLKEVVR